MASVKFEFAKRGTITDGSAANLPLDAFSYMGNVRCQNNVIERGPVCRTVGSITGKPRHIVSYKDSNLTPRVFISKLDGTVVEYTGNGIETDRTATGWTPFDSEASVTSTMLNGVLYVNRADRTPWFRAMSASGAFQRLDTSGTGFPSNYRFKALRECGGVLIGLAPTISGAANPTMVKWSTIASTFGEPPIDWDYASTTSSAGENILAEMRGEIIDGCKLGNNLMIYGSEETWVVEPTLNINMFSFRRVHGNGVLNVNCVVEHAGVHFVFGDREIYMADGNSVQPIDSGVHDFIYKSMVMIESHRAFAVHDKIQNSIYFGYVSNDPKCHFKYGPPHSNVGVNKLACWNYVSKTWTFADVPFITCSAMGLVSSGQTFADLASMTFEQIGGSFASLADERTVLMMPSNGWSRTGTSGTVTNAPAVFTYEPALGVAGSAINLEATAPVILEKVMIDLDELKADTNQQKHCKCVYVQAELQPGSALMFELGSSDMPTATIDWTVPQAITSEEMRADFDGFSGRYLALRITYDDFRDFKIASLTPDIELLGLR